MASAGYPESSHRGDVITGSDEVDAEPDIDVLQAGTALEGGRLVTAGGRVLAVTATGPDLARARSRAYQGVTTIGFEGAQWRHDIAALATSDGVGDQPGRCTSAASDAGAWMQ
jgi:phosphoribosylamine--glycine ligase